MRKLRLGVLVSGRGSNLAAIAEAAASGALSAEVACVVSNRPEAGALEVARARGIPAHVVESHGVSRAAHEARVDAILAGERVDLVALAGYMRLFTPEFARRHAGRLVNVHPSLLPAFKGLDAPAQAHAAGARVAGCTTHFVTEDMDAGPIILQAALAVDPLDTPETLAERIRALEHRLYPRTIQLIAEGRVRLENGRVTILGARGSTATIESPEA